LPDEEHRLFKKKIFQRDLYGGQVTFLPWEEAELNKFIGKVTSENKLAVINGWDRPTLLRFLEANK
jgi:hypothetical protein